MFLTKMVKDFLENIKSSNQNQTNQKPTQNPLTATEVPKYKSNKKLDKIKKNIVQIALNEELPQISNKNQLSFKEQTKIVNKSVAPTKVKSGSWKRSEKTIISPYNTLTNKKSKNLRKKSRSHNKIQGSDKLTNSFEPTSACRPGTLYSDVLFGATRSNLVKIKNSIPKHNHNITSSSKAQKKLSKALFKLSDQHEYDTSDESEIENKNNVFPALEKLNNKISSSCITNQTIKPSTSNTVNIKHSQEILEKVELTSDTIAPLVSPKMELSQKSSLNSLAGFQNLCSNNQNENNDNNFEENFKIFINDLQSEPDSLSKNNKFVSSLVSNIPEWNFTDVNTTFDIFPKFLCQFDDERYLEAEKMASLSLKLAMGNNPIETKFKL